MIVTLIRHTPVDLPSGICYGSADVPLAAGVEEAASQILHSLPPAPRIILSSPSQRCRKLAELLAPFHEVDQRLRELNFGDWELKPWTDIPREQLEAWAGDFVHRSPPNGETFAALAQRAREAVSTWTAAHPGVSLVCVTHAGVIRALSALQTGTPLADAFNLSVGYGSVHTLDFSTATPVLP